MDLFPVSTIMRRLQKDQGFVKSRLLSSLQKRREKSIGITAECDVANVVDDVERA